MGGGGGAGDAPGLEGEPIKDYVENNSSMFVEEPTSF